MREFSVYTTGIIAFVEDYRRAVAVNAPRSVAMTVSNGPGRSEDITIPAHFPYIRIPINHLDDTTLAQFRIVHDWNVSGATTIFPITDPDNPGSQLRQTVVQFLNFQEVVLSASNTPASIDNTPLNIPNNDHSVQWLVRMEELGTTADTIDPRHVVKDPLDVAAYIRFPSGAVSTALTTKTFKCVSVNILDGKLAGTLQRAVAQLLVCKFEVPDEEFTVRCRDYRPGPDPDFEIVFKADVPNPWMVFASTSLDDAFQLPSVEPKYGTDTHFRHLYGLAPGVVTDADIALPKSLEPAPHAGMGRPLGS